MRIPSHPGRLLREEMQTRGLTANRLALDLGVPANRIGAILKQTRGISPETALRLGRYFGTGPELWLSMQMKHDLGKASAVHDKEIKRSVRKVA